VHGPDAESATWISKSRLAATSQRNTTRVTQRVAPRSTLSHWGSEYKLDQRVAAFPSMAADASKFVPSTEDAVAELARSSSTRHSLPQSAHGPPQSTAISSWFCTESEQVAATQA